MGHELYIPQELTQDICAGIEYAISLLPYREQEVIKQRYVERKYYAVIAEFFSLSRDRARQIEVAALRRLRKPRRLCYIQHGIAGYVETKKKESYERGYNAGYERGYKNAVDDINNGVTQKGMTINLMELPLANLKLSVRAFNCLHRAGYVYVGDIVKLDREGIDSIKYLGMKSAINVAYVLNENGIKNTAWDRFL